MNIESGIIVALAIAIGVWLFLRWKSPRPDYEPLITDPNDPLIAAALVKAKASIPQFLSLARASKKDALVKLRFVSNSDQVEHLWAEVLEVLSDQELGVRIVTPPVTHSGKLNDVFSCNIEDIEDWQVRDGDGHLYGGFSQRAMFAIARRDGVKLSSQLLEHEHEYRDT